MIKEAFYKYVTSIFEPHLNKHCLEKIAVLFMDGHTFHIALNLSTFCSAHGIAMVALSSNPTHLMQAMEVGVFHPSKVLGDRK